MFEMSDEQYMARLIIARAMRELAASEVEHVTPYIEYHFVFMFSNGTCRALSAYGLTIENALAHIAMHELRDTMHHVVDVILCD